jgi:hypothetical protein
MEAQPAFLPWPLPWDAIAAPWERAENSLARLDQTLGISALAPAWTARAHLAEAAASAWLDGAAVPLEDLVLHDADTCPRLPTPALFKARSILFARRALDRRAPADVLSRAGILELHGRRQGHEGGERLSREDGRAGEDGWAGEEDGREDRIAAWLRLVADLGALPALPAAALAFHAWTVAPPVRRGGGVLGRLLIPVMLRARGTTRHHALAFATGLQQARPRSLSGSRHQSRPGSPVADRRDAPFAGALAEILEAIALAAAHGLERHRRLVLAKAALARPLAGRRSSSRLAALAELLLGHPLVSAPMAARHLGLSLRGATLLIEELVRAGCVRERTGRARYRAFSLA